MGIDVDVEDVYSSMHATLEYLRRELPDVRRPFVLGTASLQREFESEGYAVAGESADEAPDAVVVAFDTGLIYERLCRAAYWIAEGIPFIATHPDRVCPTDRPTVLVDCGSICAALEQATGRAPIAVPGKPSPMMLAGLMQRRGVEQAELAMVGDRLYTDIAMANAAGVLSVLVLSGESTAADANAAADSDTPALIVRDVGELGRRLIEARESRR
jgi:NagD protein